MVLALLNGNPLFLKNRSWLLKMASVFFRSAISILEGYLLCLLFFKHLFMGVKQ